jgi:PAT family beta-lactamase induction signal transducer AmpG
VDAYRADILEPNETGAGAAVLVLGYRVALILTGSIALILADRIRWPAVYLLLAGVMLAVTAVSRLVPQTPAGVQPPATLTDAVRLPFIEFFERQGWLTGISILAFVVFYRFGDAMISNMSTPFLLQAGFTQSDVGAIQGGLGLIATIGGVFAGGAVIGAIGLNRSLWVLGGAQALSNLAYVALARSGSDYGLLTITIVTENICSGLGTAALVGFMTYLCNPRFSATQYALLSSVMAVTRDVLVAPAGALAEVTGWPLFFLLSFLAAFPGFLLLPRFAPWKSRGHEVPGD